MKKAVDLGDGEDIGADLETVTTDSSRKGEQYDVEKTPGMYLTITGHFKNLPDYLRKIYRRLMGG